MNIVSLRFGCLKGGLEKTLDSVRLKLKGDMDKRIGRERS